jgi:glycosyltransferase involved in cell wall biosynthesis
MNHGYKNDQATVFIIVDNLKIGGIQRLALDEGYYFKNSDVKAIIIVLDEAESEDSIVQVDKKYYVENPLDILYVGHSNFYKIFNLTKLIRNYGKQSIFVTHSASGVVFARIASVISLRKIKIILWIHQVITLSDKTQSYKRIFYSLLATKIYFGAAQFQSEWVKYIDSRRIIRKFYNKKTQVSRIGVYLNRVLWDKHDCIENDHGKNLVFASRLTKWKGIDTLERISQELLSDGYKTIIMTAKNSGSLLVIQDLYASSAFRIILDKCPSNLRGINNLIHIYPTDYGGHTTYPQSIGLNVLEFLALGIPSIISEESFKTFPELKNCLLIETCDWADISQLKTKVHKLESLSSFDRISASLSVRDAISIEHHAKVIISEIKG